MELRGNRQANRINNLVKTNEYLSRDFSAKQLAKRGEASLRSLSYHHFGGTLCPHSPLIASTARFVSCYDLMLIRLSASQALYDLCPKDAGALFDSCFIERQ